MNSQNPNVLYTSTPTPIRTRTHNSNQILATPAPSAAVSSATTSNSSTSNSSISSSSISSTAASNYLTPAANYSAPTPLISASSHNSLRNFSNNLINQQTTIIKPPSNPVPILPTLTSLTPEINPLKIIPLPQQLHSEIDINKLQAEKANWNNLKFDENFIQYYFLILLPNRKDKYDFCQIVISYAILAVLKEMFETFKLFQNTEEYVSKLIYYYFAHRFNPSPEHLEFAKELLKHPYLNFNKDYENNLNIVDLLIEYDCQTLLEEINIEERNFKTLNKALYIAAKLNNTIIFKKLIEKYKYSSFDFNYTLNPEEYSREFLAEAKKLTLKSVLNHPYFKYLPQHGLERHKNTEKIKFFFNNLELYKESMLYLALMNNNRKLFNLLIEYPLKLDEICELNKTVLLIAYDKRNKRAFEKILAKLEIQVRSKTENNIVLYILNNKNIDLEYIKLVLEAGKHNELFKMNINCSSWEQIRQYHPIIEKILLTDLIYYHPEIMPKIWTVLGQNDKMVYYNILKYYHSEDLKKLNYLLDVLKF